MRGHVEVVGAQAQGGAQDDLVENGRGGVHQQVAAAAGLHDPPEVARVGRQAGKQGSEEAPGALGVAVAAPDDVALALEQLGQEAPGGPGSQDEDAHSRGRL